MIVCMVLIWFLLTVLRESGNLNSLFVDKLNKIREGSKKNINLWSLTITGGGVSPNHTLIAKLHCFFLNIIYIFNYTQFVVIPK